MKGCQLIHYLWVWFFVANWPPYELATPTPGRRSRNSAPSSSSSASHRSHGNSYTMLLSQSSTITYRTRKQNHSTGDIIAQRHTEFVYVIINKLCKVSNVYTVQYSACFNIVKYICICQKTCINHTTPHMKQL